jgi:hypothetical protein
MLQYFAARAHFSVEKDNVLYKNPDTGVYFFMSLRCARNILFQRNVISAEFEVNYCSFAAAGQMSFDAVECPLFIQADAEEKH